MQIIEVGRSELAGRTFGVMQTLEWRSGLQLLGLIADVLNRTGYRLTVNEGRRSRRDQQLVWNAWVLYRANRGPWAPRAAPPFTSRHDEILHGNAFDLGGPGGEVIRADVHAVILSICAAYGIRWTGASFVPSEWWHFEYVGDEAIVVPESIRDTPRPAQPKPVPVIEQKENDVAYIGIDQKGRTWVLDPGPRTKWDITKGLKTKEQVAARIAGFRAHGLPRFKVRNEEIAAFRDITDNNSREYL